MEAIVFFDGLCNLCNGSVQFILSHEKNHVLKFASLQSELGQKALVEMQLPSSDLNTILFKENGRMYSESDAVLRIAKYLDSPYRYLNLFGFVPKFIRDYLYRWVSRNRYRWFGKKEQCWIPTPEYKERFVG